MSKARENQNRGQNSNYPSNVICLSKSKDIIQLNNQYNNEGIRSEAFNMGNNSKAHGKLRNEMYNPDEINQYYQSRQEYLNSQESTFPYNLKGQSFNSNASAKRVNEYTNV